MRKIYRMLVVLSAAASLASCSQGAYVATQQAATTINSEPIASVAAPQDAATITIPAAHVGAIQPKVVVAAPRQHATKPVSGLTATQRPTLVQRLVLKKLVKQAASMQAARQNTAEVAKPASSTKGSLFITLAGLVIILIGGLIGGTNIVVTIGGVVLVVGLVLLLASLIRG